MAKKRQILPKEVQADAQVPWAKKGHEHKEFFSIWTKGLRSSQCLEKFLKCFEEVHLSVGEFKQLRVSLQVGLCIFIWLIFYLAHVPCPEWCKRLKGRQLSINWIIHGLSSQDPALGCQLGGRLRHVQCDQCQYMIRYKRKSTVLGGCPMGY